MRWQAIPSYARQTPAARTAGYIKKRLAAYRRRSGYGIEPMVSSNDTAAAMAKLLLQASQERAPDISQVDTFIFGRVAPYAEPIDGHLRRLGLRLDDWFPHMRRAMTDGGRHVRGLQFTSDVRVLYYRKDLVRTPPAGWAEMTDMGVELARCGHAVLFPGAVGGFPVVEDRTRNPGLSTLASAG